MIAIEPDGQSPIAWRCEQDRKLHPAAEGSYVVYIEEIGAAWYGSTVKRRPYFVRRMIVCRPCRRTIANMEGDNDGERSGGTKLPAEGQTDESMGDTE